MNPSDWRHLDGIPLDGDEPVFDEPWQAQAFAIAVSLNERGIFDWPDWAEKLGAAIAKAPDVPYWSHWIDTLENMLKQKNIANSDMIEQRATQWHEAAARTPHGEPITLDI